MGEEGNEDASHPPPTEGTSETTKTSELHPKMAEEETGTMGEEGKEDAGHPPPTEDTSETTKTSDLHPKMAEEETGTVGEEGKEDAGHPLPTEEPQNITSAKISSEKVHGVADRGISEQSGGGVAPPFAEPAVTRVAARRADDGALSAVEHAVKAAEADEKIPEIDLEQVDGSACCGEDEWPRLLTPQEVEQIHAVPGNRQCADCLRSALGPDGEEARPSWASTNLLVTLSPQAAGVHRSMGAHVSKVLSLTLDEWTHEDFKLMLQGGNDEANKRLESHSAALSFKPDLRSGPGAEKLEAYIRSKYMAHAFCEGGSGKLMEAEKRASCAVAATEYSGIIFVRIVRAQGLPSMDVASESDPYVIVKLRGGHQTMRTTTKQDCNNPLWNETLTLNYRSLKSDIIDLQVWDADVVTKDDLIGTCQLALSEIIDAQTPPDTVYSRTCIVDDGMEDYCHLGGCRAAGCCLLPPCIYMVKPCVVTHQRGTLSVEVSYAPLS